MSDLTLTVPVYVNLDPGGPVLVKSSTNQLGLGPLRVVSGDERLFSFRLHQTPEGSTWQRVGLPSGWTMVLSGKRAPGGETAYFTNSTWTSTGSGSSLAYTATLDWAVSDSIWDNAPNGVVPFRMDLEIRDATNTVRGTVQFDVELSRENYGSGDTPDDPDSPFLDRTAADNIYLSFAAAQTLTDEQADQAISNLKGTTASTPNRLAKRNSLGWLLARAFDTDDDNNGIRIQGLRHGTVTVTVFGATDQYVFDSEAFPPTGIQTGMYLYGGFPEGTTVISTNGGVITTSAGLLGSGTVTVFASTSSADPRPKIVLTRGGSPVFTLAYDGSITGPSATLGNLIVNGGLFRVDESGNIETNNNTQTGTLFNYSGLQGLEYSPLSILGYDDTGAPTFGLYSQSGAATFTGDMWLGAFSGTGQGILISRTGIWGYDTGSGNTFGFDTETGLLIATTLQLNSYTLTLGGNVAFDAFGRTLAATATAAAARTALALGTADSPSFAGLSIGGYTIALGGNVSFGAFGRTLAAVTDGPSARATLGLTRMSPIAMSDAAWTTPAAISGTVALNTYTSGARIGAINTGVAGFSRFYMNIGNVANFITASRTTLNWSTPFRINFRALIYVNANSSSKVTFLIATANTTVAHDLAALGLGIQAYGDGSSTYIRLQGHNGTTATNGTAVPITASDDTFYDFELVWTPGTSAILYRDDVSLCTLAPASNLLPSGNGAGGATCPMLLFQNGAGSSDATTVRLLHLLPRR